MPREKAANSTLPSADVNSILGNLKLLGGTDGLIHAAALASDVARANLLTNGGFDIWQRGNGPFTATNAYTADRWQIVLGGTSTISVSKDTTNQDAGSSACLAATYTHNAASSIQQKLEELAQLKTRSISLGVRVKASVDSSVRAWISTDGGTTKTYSGYHSGGGTYETLKVENISVPTGATAVQVGVELAASGTYYLDNGMLVVGSVAADYVPMHPADEWERCQRYYERHGFGTVAVPRVTGYQAAGGPIGQTVVLVRKAAVPTVTVVGTFAVTNCGQPSVQSVTQCGYWIAISANAAGTVDFYANDSSTGVIAEANP